MNVQRPFFPAVGLAMLLVAALCFQGPVFGHDQDKDKDKDKPNRPLVKWEYKVIASSNSAAQMEEALNKLGEEGWECVGTVTPVTLTAGDPFGGGFGGAGKGKGKGNAKGATNLILKRPKQ